MLDIGAAVELAAKPRWEVRDRVGQHIASVDSMGNFVVEGVIQTSRSSFTDQPGVPEFFVMDGATVLAKIEGEADSAMDYADLELRGSYYERVSVDLDSGVTVQSFRIRDVNGDTVALINKESFTNSNISPSSIPAGSLLIKGRVYMGDSPDRVSSHGV